MVGRGVQVRDGGRLRGHRGRQLLFGSGRRRSLPLWPVIVVAGVVPAFCRGITATASVCSAAAHGDLSFLVAMPEPFPASGFGDLDPEAMGRLPGGSAKRSVTAPRRSRRPGAPGAGRRRRPRRAWPPGDAAGPARPNGDFVVLVAGDDQQAELVREFDFVSMAVLYRVAAGRALPVVRLLPPAKPLTKRSRFWPAWGFRSLARAAKRWAWSGLSRLKPGACSRTLPSAGSSSRARLPLLWVSHCGRQPFRYS